MIRKAGGTFEPSGRRQPVVYGEQRLKLLGQDGAQWSRFLQQRHPKLHDSGYRPTLERQESMVVTRNETTLARLLELLRLVGFEVDQDSATAASAVEACTEIW